MRLVSGTDMKKMDNWAVNEYMIPSLLLMENAGRAVAVKALEILDGVSRKQVLILAGKGNNGGDALVAARHLSELGAEVKLFLFFPPEQFGEDALINWGLLDKLGINYNCLNDENSLYLLKLRLNQCDLIIDGIFGTGFRGKPDDATTRAIQTINESGVPILAIDVPSGLNADTGEVEGECIQARYTVTFAYAKRGLVMFPGKKYAGSLEVAHISLPQKALEIVETEEYYIDETFAQKLLPPRQKEGFKNTFGHVLVVAGSAGMTGAAFLASRAVLRSGAGLVTACLPSSLANEFDVVNPEVITCGVEETKEGTISSAAGTEIKRRLQGKQAVIFGPGLGATAEIRGLLEKMLEGLHVPLIIDADGLNVLALDGGILNRVQCPLILTPHPGEMARLLGLSTAEVQKDRVVAAQEAAVYFNAVVVLKGAATVTATPQGQVFINSSGCSALATAGSGDVLSGVIGGLAAQGIEPVAAAVLGVYIHGLAGEIAAKELGERSVMAGDVLERLPYAFRHLETTTTEVR